MDSFLTNAQEIFDVARAEGNDEREEFALLIDSEGGIRMIMGAPFAFEAVAAGCRSAYQVTRGREGVRLVGRSGGKTCMFQENCADPPRMNTLPGEAFYTVVSPLRIASVSESGALGGGSPFEEVILLANRGELARQIPHRM
jgi:hypothetical protein